MRTAEGEGKGGGSVRWRSLGRFGRWDLVVLLRMKPEISGKEKASLKMGWLFLCLIGGENFVSFGGNRYADPC